MKTRVKLDDEIVFESKGLVLRDGTNRIAIVPEGAKLIFFGCPQAAQDRLPGLGQRPTAIYSNRSSWGHPACGPDGLYFGRIFISVPELAGSHARVLALLPGE